MCSRSSLKATHLERSSDGDLPIGLRFWRFRCLWLILHLNANASNPRLDPVTDIPEEGLHVLKDISSIFPGGSLSTEIYLIYKKITRRRKLICAYEAAVIKTMRSVIHSRHQKRTPNWCSTGTTAVEEKPHDDDVLLARTRPESLCFHAGKESPILLPSAKSNKKDKFLRELAILNEDIQLDQRKLTDPYQIGDISKEFPYVDSAFVQFTTSSSARMACQTFPCLRPLRLLARHVGVGFEDMRWECLSFRWWNRYMRTGAVSVAIVSLLVLWLVPVAFTGFLSQITTLAISVAWLSWLATAPPWPHGIIQGVLPQMTLTLLTIVLPRILRAIADHEGHPTKISIELSLQRYYFTFLFLQTFLTVALSSSLTGIAQDVTPRA